MPLPRPIELNCLLKEFFVLKVRLNDQNTPSPKVKDVFVKGQRPKLYPLQMEKEKELNEDDVFQVQHNNMNLSAAWTKKIFTF